MKKIRIFLTEDEWKFVIAGLNDYLNKLIAEGNHTDFADEVLLKTITVSVKKIKTA